MRFSRLALGFLLLSGCTRPAEQRFPIGIFGVDGSEHKSELEEFGFDAFASDPKAGLSPEMGGAVLVQSYPIPGQPLYSVAERIEEARKGLPLGKPLCAVLQAHNRADLEPQLKKKPQGGRFPDFSEIRFMTYLAIVHGASGIYYYTLKKPEGQTLFDYPEEFQAVWRVARELKAMQPIFERGTPAEVPFAAPDKRIEMKAFRYRWRDYVIVLNASPEFALPYPEQLRERRWRPLFEPRRNIDELLFEQSGKYFLRAQQVLVLESGWRGGLRAASGDNL